MGNIAISQRSVCKTGVRYSSNCCFDIIPLMRLTELTDQTGSDKTNSLVRFF